MNARTYLQRFLLILVAAACAACSAKLVRGASPIVQMNSLNQQGATIDFEVSMRNLNGVEMNINAIDITLMVEDELLFSYQGAAETGIAANGVETWAIQIEQNDVSQRLLKELEDGDIKSLPYALSGSVGTIEDGTLRFEHEGHIYPVPGRPGQFR